MDIHHASRAEAILRRQGTGDEMQRVDNARAQFLSKTRNAFWQEHIVNSILKVGMLAAKMQPAVAAESCAVPGALNSTWLTEVFHLSSLDLALVYRVNRRAQFRQDLFPGDIQLSDYCGWSQFAALVSLPDAGVAWAGELWARALHPRQARRLGWRRTSGMMNCGDGMCRSIRSADLKIATHNID